MNDRQILDAIAVELHPHWQSLGNTYVAEQLPDMVRDLKTHIAELEARNATLQAILDEVMNNG